MPETEPTPEEELEERRSEREPTSTTSASTSSTAPEGQRETKADSVVLRLLGFSQWKAAAQQTI